MDLKIIPCARPITHAANSSEYYVDLEFYYRLANGSESIEMDEKLIESLESIGVNLRQEAMATAETELVIEGFGEMLGIPFFEAPFLIATTKDGSYGAGLIFFAEDRLVEVARTLGLNKLTVVPASIHEMLILKNNMESSEIDNVIRRINQKVVSPKDRLADHHYIFDVQTKTWSY